MEMKRSQVEKISKKVRAGLLVYTVDDDTSGFLFWKRISILDLDRCKFCTKKDGRSEVLCCRYCRFFYSRVFCNIPGIGEITTLASEKSFY